MQVTVYSAANCRNCRYTERHLSREGIEYTTVKLDENPELLEAIKREVLEDPRKALQMPVVRVDLGPRASWTFQGYAPSQIEKLKKHLDGFDPKWEPEVAA